MARPRPPLPEGEDQRLAFPVSRARLWDGLLKALEASPVTVRSLNKALMRAEVSSGMTMMSFGQNFVVQVESVDAAHATLTVTPKTKFPSARDRARTVRVANNLAAQVSSQLAGRRGAPGDASG